MSSIDAPEGLTLKTCAAGSESLLALWRDFESGRLAHATLLTGEGGTGKRTFSHLLAQGLLCSATVGDKPCGQCRDCRRFLARTHPDALFPAPAPKEKTIRIDALREMIDALSRHSLEGGRRVVVLDQADRMTPQAQNCLLKTLEDGAEDTWFFLTADTETALLPTVRSRCRCVRVQPWSEERIERALVDRGIAPGRARQLSFLCEGSLGRALQMEQDDSYWAARDLVRRSFLSVRQTADLPAAAQLLKDQKENGDRLLDILEQEIRSLIDGKAAAAQENPLPPFWAGATEAGLRRILEGILAARRQKNANVGWAALSEGLMQTISEETSKWQV